MKVETVAWLPLNRNGGRLFCCGDNMIAYEDEKAARWTAEDYGGVADALIRRADVVRALRERAAEACIVRHRVYKMACLGCVQSRALTEAADALEAEAE